MKRKIDWKGTKSVPSITGIQGCPGIPYLYPNRPILIPPDPINPLEPKSTYLDELERSGKYIAEQKWNGDNTLIFTDTMELWNRTRARLKYNPTDQVRKELEQLPKGCLINAELVHNHTKTVKDTIIVHCIMAYKGEPLMGKTWAESRAIIEEFRYGDHVKLSKLWSSGFFELWKEADGEVIEGIVLKDPKGVLKFSMVPISDVSWMMKVRKPCKKYSF